MWWLSVHKAVNTNGLLIRSQTYRPDALEHSPDLIRRSCHTNLSEVNTVCDYCDLQPRKVRDGRLRLMNDRWGNSQIVFKPDAQIPTTSLYKFRADAAVLPTMP